MLLSQLFKHRTIYYGLLKVQIIDSMKYIFLFYPWNWTLLLKLFLCQVWEITADKHHAGSVLHTLGWPLDPKTYGGSFLYHMEDRQVFLIDTCIPSWNDNWVCNLIHKVAFNWRNLLNGSSDRVCYAYVILMSIFILRSPLLRRKFGKHECLDYGSQLNRKCLYQGYPPFVVSSVGIRYLTLSMLGSYYVMDTQLGGIQWQWIIWLRAVVG